MPASGPPPDSVVVPAYADAPPAFLADVQASISLNEGLLEVVVGGTSTFKACAVQTSGTWARENPSASTYKLTRETYAVLMDLGASPVTSNGAFRKNATGSPWYRLAACVFADGARYAIAIQVEAP